MRRNVKNDKVLKAISLGLATMIIGSTIASDADLMSARAAEEGVENEKVVVKEVQEVVVVEEPTEVPAVEVVVPATPIVVTDATKQNIDDAEAALKEAIKDEHIAGGTALVENRDGIVWDETVAVIADALAKAELDKAEAAIAAGEKKVNDELDAMDDELDAMDDALDAVEQDKKDAEDARDAAVAANEKAQNATNSGAAAIAAGEAQEAADAAAIAADNAKDDLATAEQEYKDAIKEYNDAVAEAAAAKEKAENAVKAGLVDAEAAVLAANVAEMKAATLKNYMNGKKDYYTKLAGEKNAAFAEATQNLKDANKEFNEAVVNEIIAGAGVVETGIALDAANKAVEKAEELKDIAANNVEAKKKAIQDLKDAKAEAERLLAEAKTAMETADGEQSDAYDAWVAADNAVKELAGQIAAAEDELKDAQEAVVAATGKTNDDAAKDYESAIVAKEKAIIDAKNAEYDSDEAKAEAVNAAIDNLAQEIINQNCQKTDTEIETITKVDGKYKVTFKDGSETYYQMAADTENKTLTLYEQNKKESTKAVVISSETYSSQEDALDAVKGLNENAYNIEEVAGEDVVTGYSVTYQKIRLEDWDILPGDYNPGTAYWCALWGLEYQKLSDGKYHAFTIVGTETKTFDTANGPAGIDKIVVKSEAIKEPTTSYKVSIYDVENKSISGLTSAAAEAKKAELEEAGAFNVTIEENRIEGTASYEGKVKEYTGTLQAGQVIEVKEGPKGSWHKVTLYKDGRGHLVYKNPNGKEEHLDDGPKAENTHIRVVGTSSVSYTVVYDECKNVTTTEYVNADEIEDGNYAYLSDLVKARQDAADKVSDLATKKDTADQAASDAKDTYDEKLDAYNAAKATYDEKKADYDAYYTNREKTWYDWRGKTKYEKDLNAAKEALAKAEGELLGAEINLWVAQGEQAIAREFHRAALRHFNQTTKDLAEATLNQAKAFVKWGIAEDEMVYANAKLAEYTVKAAIADDLEAKVAEAQKEAIEARDAIKKILESGVNVSAEELAAARQKLQDAAFKLAEAQKNADDAAKAATEAEEALKEAVERVDQLIREERARRNGGNDTPAMARMMAVQIEDNLVPLAGDVLGADRDAEAAPAGDVLGADRPQTGDFTTVWGAALGAVASGMMIAGYAARRKKEEE